MSLYNADDESAAPTTPATGRKILYPKADGWYYKDDAGVEHQLANSSGAVLTLPQINDTSSDHQYIFAVNELTADRTVTLPLLTGNDEFVFKDFTQALTNKTINGNTITSGSGTLALGAGKTLTASNTLTLTATDGSTLAIGTGGTLGTAAYIAASSKQDVDATLTSIALLGTAADKIAYSTGVDTWAETPLTAAARTFLDDATVADAVDTLGGAASTGTGGLVRKTGAAIDPASIGATTPGSGVFTTLSASSCVVSDSSSNAVTSSIINNYAGGKNWTFFSSGGGPAPSGAWGLYNSTEGQTALTYTHGVGLAVTEAISATATLRTGGYTVVTLPAGATGDRAYVTDATAPAYLGALTGGGAVVCPVFKNASAWVSA